MRHAEDGSFKHRGMRHDRVLHVDRGNPLATTLDYILDSIGEFDVAKLVDSADVPAAPVAIVGELLPGVGHLMVLRGDPGTTHADLAGADPIVWQIHPFRVPYCNVDAGRRQTLLALEVPALSLGQGPFQCRLEPVYGHQCCLRATIKMDHLCPSFVVETAHQR